MASGDDGMPILYHRKDVLNKDEPFGIWNYSLTANLIIILWVKTAIG
jgi:hypothetical protein